MPKVRKENGEKYCRQCDLWFKSLAGHWAQSSNCTYPQFPKPLHDVVFGLLITQGRFEQCSDERNRFRVTKNSKEKLETLQSVFGVYANGIGEEEEVRDTFNTGMEMSRTYRLGLMPFGNIHQKNDLKISNVDIITKTIFFMAGRLASPGGTPELKLTLSAPSYSIFKEINTPPPTSHYEREKDSFGSLRHVLRFDRSVYDRYSSLDWPGGWWNDGLSPHCPRCGGGGRGD